MTPTPYEDMAVFIHTFLRDDLMYRCVASVKEYLPGARIYLSDGGRMTDEKREFYKQLEAEGHWVKHYEEFNIWWRKAFNEKAQIATEEYILKLDDDFYIDGNTHIDKFYDVIDADNRIGLVGGAVWHEHRSEKSPYIYKVVEKVGDKYRLDFAEQEDYGYTICDFVPDFWLADRKIFDVIKMDPDLKPAQGGHEKFFTEIYEKRQNGEIDWKVAYTNEVLIQHEKSVQTTEYKNARASGLHGYERVSRVIKP